jgi:hypothetical protein
MRVWGFSVGSAKGHPVVLGVEADGSRGALSVGRVFEFPASSEDDLPEQMRRLMDAAETAFAHGTPDAVVFRLLDHAIRGRAERTTRSHALAEGVVLATAKRAVVRVYALPPVLLAQRCGTDKASLDAEAAGVFGKRFAEAGAAAIAGLVLLAGP